MNELLDVWAQAGRALSLAVVRTTEVTLRKLPRDNGKGIAMNTRPNLTRKYVKIAAFVIAALMLLFPPKDIKTMNPFGGAPMVQEAGYTFVFTDPAAAQKSFVSGLPGADQYIQSGIEWGKLLAQFLVLGVATCLVLRVTQEKPWPEPVA